MSLASKSVLVVLSLIAVGSAACASPEGDAAVDESGGQAVSLASKTTYEGTVAGQQVRVRLTNQGGALTGEYFHAAEGKGITLAGRLTGSQLTLDETVDGEKTGSFRGRVGPGNVLSGTWTGGGRSHPFTLSPTRRAPEGTATIATRKAELTGTRCKAHLTYPEVFGLEAGAEEKINASIRAASRIEGMGPNDACNEDDDMTVDATVLANEKGVLSVRLRRESTAGMMGSISFGYVNVAIASGEAITLRNMFDDENRKKMGTIAGAYFAAAGAMREDAASERDALDGIMMRYIDGIRDAAVSFEVRPAGLAFSVVNELPTSTRALDDGVVVAWRHVTPNLLASSALLPYAEAHANDRGQ